VLASIANPQITLAVFSIVIVAFLTFAGAAPTVLGVALFIAYCVGLAVLVAGFSLAASVLFLKYRDLNQVWDVIAQAGFFIAPIIYPLGIVPERFHFYFYLWPPTPIIEFSRAALIRHQPPSPTAHVYLLFELIVVVTVGVFVMRRYGPRAAEYL
jgi:lipopolysaccharide transport system permease protein